MRAVILMLLLAAGAFGQLAGAVRDSVSRLPVANAKMVVTGPVMKGVESNATGDFRVEDVPAGKYTIHIAKPGYENSMMTVDVKPGGDPLTLELRPRAEASGVILDEDGKPLEGVVVYLGGLRDTTDKEGRYYAKEFPAGRYTPTFRLPYELRRETAIRDEKTGETFGYANTLYYPGVPDQKLAGFVTIAPGARMMNLDFRFRRARLVEMKGKVVGGAAGMEIELDSGSGRPDETFEKRKLDEHGGFHFDLLTPAVYQLAVHRNRPGDDLPYITPAALGQAGVQDLEVVLEFVRLEGVVKLVHPQVKWDGLLHVTLGRLGYNMEVWLAPEGRFSLNAVPPGDWSLMVDTNLLHRPDDPKRKLYVVGGWASTLPVTESGNPPLEIALTDETGRISGIADDFGLIVVTPAGAAPVAFSASQFAIPQPKDGTFSIDVPPGEYRLVMAKCSAPGEPVTVTSGGTVNVHVKACK